MTAIARVKYHHDAMIDLIIANPSISQNEIAATFGFTPSWVSIIVNSDSFKARLKERKEEVIDPLLRATVEDRLTAVANKAAEKFLERLATNAPISNKDLIEAMKVSTGGLGMGPVAKQAGPVQNLYIVPTPARPASSAQWAQMARGEVVENQPSEGG